MLTRPQLDKWAKSLSGFKPFKEEPTSQVRWEIAYNLASLNENFQTSAHVLTNLRWDCAPHIPVLRICAGAIESIFNEYPTLSEANFKKHFKPFFSWEE